MVGGQTTTKYIRQNRLRKLHRLKSQPKFSEPSKTERHEPFDFPTRISGFTM